MTDSALPANAGFRSTLRNRYFLRLWIAQLISQTVQNATNYGAIVLLARQSQGSFTAVGGVVIAFSLPALIFGIPAGIVVDRIDKRAVLTVSNGLRAVAAFGFVLSLLANSSAFVPIYLLTFFVSIVGQFFGPAEGAAIPLLVKREELVPALSLFNITFSFSQALGLILIGPLIISGAPTINFGSVSNPIPFTSIHTLFLFASVMYVICTLLTASIPAAKLKGLTDPSNSLIGRRLTSVWKEVGAAWSYVRTNKQLLVALMQLTLGGTVISIISIIAPLFAQQFLHRDPSLAAIVFVPAGTGLVVGSILMPRIVSRINATLAEALGIVGLGSSIILLIFARALAQQIAPTSWYNATPYLLSAVLLIFFIGFSLDLITLPAQTDMQQRSPDWYRGRVLALQTMLLNGVTIPVIILVGRAADVWGLSVAMGVLAAGVMVLGLSGVWYADRVRESVPESSITILSEDDPAFQGTPSHPLIIGSRRETPNGFADPQQSPKKEPPRRQTSHT